MARHVDGSTDTLESEFEQVYQPAAPQVIQLSTKLVDDMRFTRNPHIKYAESIVQWCSATMSD